MLTTDELLLDDEFLETSCVADEECMQEVLRDAPAGCLYCALGRLAEEDE